MTLSADRRCVLKVELNGEWEECYFSSASEALAAFAQLVADYKKQMRRAVLLPLGKLAAKSSTVRAKLEPRHTWN